MARRAGGFKEKFGLSALVAAIVQGRVLLAPQPGQKVWQYQDKAGYGDACNSTTGKPLATECIYEKKQSEGKEDGLATMQHRY